MNELRGRIKSSALVQEGDNPPENIQDLFSLFSDLSADHGKLIRQINETNRIAHWGETNVPLLDLIGHKELLQRQRSMLQTAVDAASETGRSRWTRNEIKYVPQVDISSLRRQIDDLSNEINGLDLRIQEVNWSTDLVEL